MSNPAAVAVPVQDAGDGRWMSMVSNLLTLHILYIRFIDKIIIMIINNYDN